MEVLSVDRLAGPPLHVACAPTVKGGGLGSIHNIPQCGILVKYFPRRGIFGPFRSHREREGIGCYRNAEAKEFVFQRKFGYHAIPKA